MLEHPGKRLFHFDGLRPAIRCRKNIRCIHARHAPGGLTESPIAICQGNLSYCSR